MGLAEYLYGGNMDWEMLCGFVLRNALSEQNCKPIGYNRAYQKILIIVWLLSVFVLVQSYAGSLTAMLAKPKFQDPIKTVDELLNQREIPWVIEKGTPTEYLTSTAESGTAMRRLFEMSTLMSHLTPMERFMYGCYTTKIAQGKEKFASLCDKGSIMALLSQDFSNTGKCNYYLIEDRLLTSKTSHFAIQVKR